MNLIIYKQSIFKFRKKKKQWILKKLKYNYYYYFSLFFLNFYKIKKSKIFYRINSTGIFLKFLYINNFKLYLTPISQLYYYYNFLISSFTQNKLILFYEFGLVFRLRNFFFISKQFNNILTFWSTGMFTFKKYLKKNIVYQEQQFRGFLFKNLFKNFYWIFLKFYNMSKRLFLFLNILKEFKQLQRKYRFKLNYHKIMIITNQSFGYMRGKKLARRKRYLQRRAKKLYF